MINEVCTYNDIIDCQVAAQSMYWFPKGLINPSKGQGSPEGAAKILHVAFQRQDFDTKGTAHIIYLVSQGMTIFSMDKVLPKTLLKFCSWFLRAYIFHPGVKVLLETLLKFHIRLPKA